MLATFRSNKGKTYWFRFVLAVDRALSEIRSMFRHQGNARSSFHNLQIATVLSFVAGSVNVAGFLAVARLTTNVTGHFAFLIGDVYNSDWREAALYLAFLLFFLLGAFTSTSIVEFVRRRDEQHMYLIPALLEAMVLLAVGFFGSYLLAWQPQVIAFSLLFAMGLQNALVTKVSQSVVRTTHLTGLFTDLGIELSQLLYYKRAKERQVLWTSIRLRLRIILFFFLGGVTAGILYSYVGTYTLFIGSFCLLFGILFDELRYRKAQRNLKAVTAV